MEDKQTLTEFDRKDRDLLITLNVRVQDLIDTIKKMENTISRDIGGLQQGKLDKSEFSSHCAGNDKDFDTVKREQKTMWEKYDKHDTDITSLNRYLWIGMGILAAFQFLAPFLMDKFIK